MYRVILLCSLGLIFNSCEELDTGLPYYNEPTFEPMFLNSEELIEQKVTHKIGNFKLMDQDGITISNESVKGKIHVANFIFTSCGAICPSLTRNMKIVSSVFEENKDVVILSYSVTPWIDTQAVLKEYKSSNEITNTNWHFLTGTTDEIYQLARQSYFAEEDIGYTKDSTDFLHTEHVLLVDRKKRIRGIYNGTLRLEMEQLNTDIQTLLEGS